MANIVDVLLLAGHATIFGLDIGIANVLAGLDLQAGDHYVDLRQDKLMPCVFIGCGICLALMRPGGHVSFPSLIGLGVHKSEKYMFYTATLVFARKKGRDT